MSDPSDDLVSDETRAAEVVDANRAHTPDESGEATPEEDAAAERAAESAPDVSEAYEEAMERGANVEGEGRIP
jgi:hypothetical protein